MLSSVDWSAAWQRHHALAEGFRQAGAKVFFVENTGFRAPGPADFGRVFRRIGRVFSRPKRSKDIVIVSPLTLPPTHPLFRLANAHYFVPRLLRHLRRRGLAEDSLVLAYLPTETTLCILDYLRPALTVYDCVDNFAGHPFPPQDLADTERELLRRSDLVLTTSKYLFDEKSALHPRVLQIHHGVAEEFFIPPKPPPREYRRFCYFGTVWSAVDLAPVLALDRAGFEVTLLGPVKEPPELPLPPSVRLVGPISHERLPRALEEFDGLLLPYADSKYNQGVTPAKIYECLATGKPVLASPLPSMEGFSHLIEICRTPEDFVRTARALPATETPEKVLARAAEARRHTTPRQLSLIGEALAKALRDRQPRLPSAFTRVGGLSETTKTFVLGFSWIAVSFVLARSATFMAQFLAARFLGPEQYGGAHLILAVASLIQIIPMLGFTLALARFGSSEGTEAGRHRVVSTALTAFFAWMFLCLLMLLPFSRQLADMAHLSPRAWNLSLALAFMTTLHLVAGSALQGLTRFKQRGWAEAVYGLITFVSLTLLLAAGRRGYEELVLSYVAGLGAATAYAFWLLRPYLRPRLGVGSLPGLLPFVLLGTVNILSASFIQAPGRIAVYHFHSAEMAGIYSVYFTSTVQIALAVNNIVQTVIVPLASRPKGQQEAWALVRGLTTPLVLLCVLLGFAACALGAFLVIGRSYPLDWAWLLLFTLSATLIFIHGLLSALFFARDARGLAISSGGMLCAGLGNLFFNLVLTPRLGITGGALSLVFGYLLGLGWYFLHRPKGAPEGAPA